MSTLLIVDDNVTARHMMKTLLQSDAYTLVFAHDGQTALEHAARVVPDLILLDVMMPDMDGFEVCRRLRATQMLAEVPIIMVTALDDRESRIKGIIVGADDFITKPVDPVELRARVHTITRLNRYRRLMGERLKFERVTELSPNGILIVNASSTILMANPTFLKMVRMPEAEPISGQVVHRFFEPEERYRYTDAVNSVLSDPEHIEHFETVWLRNDGSRFPVELDIGYIEWDNAPAIQMVVRDISERVQLEAMAIENERFAANSVLSATVAHEVNTPLHTIKTCLYLADSNDTEQRAMYLKVAQDEIDRISHILRQLLDLYRPHEGAETQIDANALIERMLILTGNVFAQNGIRVEKQLQPELGQFLGRPDQITQVLLNIILNAVAAMPNSGELTLRTRNVNDPKTNALFIEIEISDTGIGMTPEVQVRIFDPFFTTKPEGSGLGLAVCQRLVSQHRGSISVESVPGEGSTFRIRLPRVTLPAEK
ncbi:MAG: response regulator [Chloroflexaceae bacterium]|nr:response regulator [Chloroflexaceae bacterium]